MFHRKVFSADVPKCWNSMLSHVDCLAANSRSTGSQQQNTDNCNCPVNNSDWRRQTTDVDNWRCWLFVCSCWTGRGSGTLVQPVMLLVTGLLQAVDGDRCVGAIVCKLDKHKGSVRRGYIAMLAVDHDYRKLGIGLLLITHLILQS